MQVSGAPPLPFLYLLFLWLIQYFLDQAFISCHLFTKTVAGFSVVVGCFSPPKGSGCCWVQALLRNFPLLSFPCKGFAHQCPCDRGEFATPTMACAKTDREETTQISLHCVRGGFSTLWHSHSIKAAGSTAIKVTGTSTFYLIWDQTMLSGFLFTEWDNSVMLLTIRKKT